MTNQLTHRHFRRILFPLLGVVLLFFQCTNEPKLPDPLEAGWKGQPVCECIEEQPTLRVLKCSFPPGVGHERHFHPTHFGYTLQGSRFRIKDASGVREVDVKTGTQFYNEFIEWHEVENIGDSTAVYLIMEPK